MSANSTNNHNTIANKCDTHGHCHCHGHNHGDSSGSSHNNGINQFLLPAVSFILLFAGIIMNHTEIQWFQNNWINISWFIIAFLPVGIPVIKEGWEALMHKDIFNEFTLMILACIGAFCIGEYPEAVGVMLFYTIGELLQDRAVDKATRNIGRLLDVRPEKNTVIKDGKYITESPKNVKPGEIIEVKPGERIPLDGELLDSEASFDTSALTGESMPRNIDKGGEVLAGMIASMKAVSIRVTRPYDDSALAKILKMVRDASGRKAPTEKFIRKFARVYTPVVILLAALIVAVPAIVGATTSFSYVFSDWLYRGLVFLVISCPCALVISVPLGYFAGIGAASRCGILFKGGNYLDSITKIDTIAFDKTGTLTTGTFQVTKVEPTVISVAKLLSIAMSVESKSTHPIAAAVVKYATGKGAKPLTVSEMKEVSGRGIEAVIEGEHVLVGNLKMMTENGVSFPDELLHTSATIVACAVNGTYSGSLFLSDKIKDDSIYAIRHLRNMGIENIYLLSGDKEEVVKEYAVKLGISEAYGGLLPENKAEYIENLINEDHKKVAFVGDGMNDAPVLALSDIGIAMGGLGSDAAVESADIVIQNDQPSKIVTAIKIGRTTRIIVRENIIGAITIKVIVLIAGALGDATLWAAVFADVGVALLAVLNSLRILYKKY